MKIYKVIAFIALWTVAGCTKLDLNPLSQGSSASWYTNETEIQMSVNDLFKKAFWPRDNDLWTDDLSFRGEVNSMNGGTLNAENSTVETIWANAYKAISRSIKILEGLDDPNSTISEELKTKYEAISRFVRASQYARLISHWGDVPYFETSLGLKESFDLARTDKNTILQSIYEDYDFAAANLPVEYGSSDVAYPTKGAALAMKARIALYMADYAVARDAAKACMDLDQYSLNPDFRSQFLSSMKGGSESIFYLPQSVELGDYESECKYYISRLGGGFGSRNPTYDLFSAFLCTDGLPVDQSTLFNPRDPFANRDPRCAETIVKPGSDWLGFRFQPHPDSMTVLNLKTGSMVKNNDNRAVNINAPFNGLLMKKGIDEDYSDDYKADPDIVIVRYADVLLMYAEAKIELNEIDGSVNDAINQVRARAYKVGVDETSRYPAVTATDQKSLRKAIRFERRMELAFEGRRYMDLIRWKLAEKALNEPSYGLLDVADLKTKVIDAGLWFFPGTPSIDDNAITDLSSLYSQGLIKLFGITAFDAGKNYLWPIPSKEIIVNPNLKQNPGY